MDRAARMEKNLKFVMAGELLLAVLKFLSRRVFVLLLGREHLGLNGQIGRASCRERVSS